MPVASQTLAAPPLLPCIEATRNPILRSLQNIRLALAIEGKEMTLLLIVVLLVALFALYHFYWKRRGLPPGPVPLPFVGNTLAIAREPPGYAAFARWTREFGPVFTVWLGQEPVVVVTDFRLMKETFAGRDADVFAGRYFLTEIAKVLTGLIYYFF